MVIKLSGGKNFRDVGGLKTADGRSVRKGLFIRGGHLSKLTDEDVEILNRINPKTIIDLRTVEESEEKPDRAVPGSEHVKKPLFSAETAGLSRGKGASLETIIRNCKGKAEYMDAIPDLANVYPLIAETDEPVEASAEVMRIVMNNAIEGRATIYHCTAGKDRTGVVTLLILTLLGVPYKTIVRDYLLTNRYVQGEANKVYIWLLAKSRSFKVSGRLRDCIVARRRYLDSFVEAITKKYGSVESFITDGLGIEADLVERFREASLV
ncbi:MAG: tyrosine-protein phosphatase [Clostridia bacterium]|nr:tyrosine-protein phosphatase [Clostridia bacterium]